MELIFIKRTRLERDFMRYTCINTFNNSDQAGSREIVDLEGDLLKPYQGKRS